MLRIYTLLIAFVAVCSHLMAGGPLKKPLTFIASDSIVVWGDDRSDFRTTALSVASELQARPVVLTKDDVKKYKKNVSSWKKDVLPALNILGSLGEVGDKDEVLPTTEMMTQAGKLFLQTADAAYLDVVERVSLNALMVLLAPGELSFEKHVAAQAMMNTSGMIYATDASGLYVNFYINSSTHVKTDNLDFVVDQLTAMPHSGRVKLRIGGMTKGQQPIVLRLRMPSWAYQAVPQQMPFALEGTPDKIPTVYVNGREEFYKMENGYLVINRLWNSGDEVFFDFPFNVQRLHSVKKGEADKGKFSLQRGPLVYGWTEPLTEEVCVEDMKFTEDVEGNRFGHSIINCEVRKTDGKTHLLETQPVMDGVKQLWLNVKK